ncbi:MAG TPA: radical SAM/SPASM domain-containing protein [Methanocorpusculum sp.]|nr:radical SAM/SPASM domain-containing protein [Methanocorpusculum sp.]
MDNEGLSKYLTDGAKRLITSVVKDPFLLAKYTRMQLRNAAVRKDFSKKGVHVPLFLIASITRSCNLHCKGCYARANHLCSDRPAADELTVSEWDRIFSEAEGLGVSFILLAGGEPLLRRDILDAAAKHENLLFAVFTNGTVFDDEVFALFEKNRNLFPVVSFEGKNTDVRRGAGTFERVGVFTDELVRRGILFGQSITVDADSYAELLNTDFLKSLRASVILFIEYTALDADSRARELTPAMQKELAGLVSDAKRAVCDKWFISFPGDEEFMGGCLAAGRGFFHISPCGSAEPCPFSPYSDRNLKSCSLLDAVSSPLFCRLQECGLVGGEHSGGCVLVQREDEVRRCLL